MTSRTFAAARLTAVLTLTATAFGQELIVDDQSGTGLFQISTGTQTFDGVIVGDTGVGQIIQSGGTLDVSDGVTARTLQLGLESGSQGSYQISGGDLNAAQLQVGVAGTGILDISNGTVSNTTGFLGISGTGISTVSGGTWTNSQTLFIGYNGSGSLGITGGTVTSNVTTLGEFSNGLGTLNLGNSGGTPGVLETSQISEGDGAGTVTFDGGTFRATADQNALFDGFESGDVTLDTGGGIFDTNTFDVSTAYGLSGDGGLTKQGDGTLTLNGTNTYTGDTTIEAGVLSINSAAALGSGDLHLTGGELNATASMDLDPLKFRFKSGTTSTVSAAANTTLKIGDFVLGDGGGADAIFGSTGNTGTIEISGGLSIADDSTLTVAGGTLRSTGKGKLTFLTEVVASTTVSSGATLDFDDDFNIFSDSNGIKNLQGSGNVVTGTDSATVLTIASGEFSGVISGAGGLNKSGSGTLTLSGANTYTGGTVVGAGTLSVAGSISHSSSNTVVGSESGDDATLSISGTSFVENAFGILGDQPGSTGTVNVSGGTWTNSVNLAIGVSGTGILNLTGGSISNVNSGIGVFANSTGTVNVSGGTWTNAVNLNVGFAGNGTLNLSSGSISDNDAFLGVEPGGSGTANVSGGTWTNFDQLQIGDGGTGMLNLTGGTVKSFLTTVGRTDTAQGTLTLGNIGGVPGILETFQITKGAGTGTVTFDGGLLRSTTENQPELFDGFEPGDISLGSGGGIFDTNGFDVSTSYGLSGVGGLQKFGTGSLTLSGSNTYLGSTTVKAGILQLDGSTTSFTFIESGGTLGGTGTVGPGATLKSGGKVAPGASIGTLTTGIFFWEPGGIMEFELGDGASDSLQTDEFFKAGSGLFEFTFVNAGFVVGQTYDLVEFAGGTDFTVGDFAFTNGDGFDGNFVLASDKLQFELTAIPEPGTIALLALGLGCAVLAIRRRSCRV